MTDTEKRIRDARMRLTGETGTQELQKWFRDKVEVLTEWRPAKSTVHRFVTEKRGSEKLERALEEIESQADNREPMALPEIGAKRARNVLLLADWLRGAEPPELEETYDLSRQRIHQIVKASGVSRADLV